MSPRFSEPRTWRECPECGDDSWRRYFKSVDPSEAFAVCPACNQPPRCTFGAGRGERCPREATEPKRYSMAPFMCDLHDRWQQLNFDKEEWEMAQWFLHHYAALAKEIGNWALEEALDVAYAQTEMSIHRIEREHEEVNGQW